MAGYTNIFRRAIVLSISGAVVLAAVLLTIIWLFQGTSPSKNPQMEFVKLFKHSRQHFDTFAKSVELSTVSKKRYSSSFDLQKIGIVEIIVTNHCIFFERSGDVFSTDGIVYSEYGDLKITSDGPPTDPKFVRIERIENDWYYYVSK